MLLEQTSGMIPPRMNKKPKLELTWIGKENRPRLEPRILLEDPEKSYHAQSAPAPAPSAPMSTDR